MIKFLRRLFGKEQKPAQMDAVHSVMDRYPHTLRDLAESERGDASKEQ